MFYFILLLLFAIVVSYKPANKEAAMFIFLGMLLLCGLRGEDVGTDTWSYLMHYRLGTESEASEPLYIWISNICRALDVPPHLFLFIMASITYVPLYFIVIKSSPNPCLSALLYMTFSVTFFGQTFNGIRQNMAMTFSLFVFYYVSNNDWRRTIVYSLLSLISHYSFAIVIPFVLLFKFISFNKKVLYIALSAAFVFGFALGQMEDFAFIFNYLGQNSDSAVMENYSKYGEDFNMSSLNLVGMLAATLPLILYSIFLYDNNNKDSLLYKLFVMGTLFSCVFLSIHFIYRLAAYFILPIIVLLPITLKRIKGFRKTALVLLTAFMVLWYFYSLVTAGPDSANGIFPYKTCL